MNCEKVWGGQRVLFQIGKLFLIEKDGRSEVRPGTKRNVSLRRGERHRGCLSRGRVKTQISKVLGGKLF